MYLTMLKGKLHRATITHVERDYEGSCAIDEQLLQLVGINEYEQVHIYNVTNGERLITYAIRAEPHSGIVSLNGAAAHKGSVGDRVIICAYTQIKENALASFMPNLVYLNETNSIERTANVIARQAA